MSTAPLLRQILRAWVAAGCLASLAIGVRAGDPSPIPETAPGLCDAWRLAEKFAAAHAHCDVMLGRGDSMLPLYRDRTVLVVQSVPVTDLRVGMTVVFIGDRGRPVAHTLLENTPAGWRAIGLGNHEPDRTLVRHGNLLGVVVRAYAPAIGGELVAGQ
jgi:hypothetical protein